MYSIGIDFGTLSARAVLVDLNNGATVSESEFVYPHAVLTDQDFDNVVLEKTDAYQHPQDYLDALAFVTKDVLEQSQISPDQVVGVGIDFTSCTVLSLTEDGVPLCFLDEFQNEPQAYAKLWKHHGAQKEAEEITDLAHKLGEPWIKNYGDNISSEWLFPKIMETLHKAPKVFDKCAYFSEAADWLVWQLTGEKVYGSCMAGYKACWNAETGYPDNRFWAQLDPKLANIVGTKVGTNVQGTGTKAGCVNALGAEFTGLKEGTVVSVPIIDAHAALPAVGISEGEKLLLILGTSGAHIIMHEKQKEVVGISGSVKGGIIPNLVAYESGQAAVGDCFEWFVKNCVPESYEQEAKARGINVYQYLTEKASLLEVGGSGLLALDWFNGNRAPYVDFDLTGVILGLNLQTKPEEIFRALIESTAFGTKSIVDIYEKNGIAVKEIYASGGISQKNRLMMQIYADVLGKEIKVIEAPQAAAKGSAILASMAGGYFDSFKEATKTLCEYTEIVYTPNQENTEKYARLYKEYLTVSEFFAKNSILKNLKLEREQ